jgi:hypothetical protein
MEVPLAIRVKAGLITSGTPGVRVRLEDQRKHRAAEEKLKGDCR